MSTSSSLSSILDTSQSGYWGDEPGCRDHDVRIVRNGDIDDAGIAWNNCPVRSLSTSEYQRARLQANDILITTSGNCGYVAYVEHDVPDEVAASNFVRILRVRNGMHPRYLYHLMNSERFRAMLSPYIRGTTLKNLSTTAAFEAVKLPIPSEAAQQRITEILDRAAGIRSKRALASSLAESLLRSSFLDLFGDSDSPGWEIATVADMAQKERGAIRTGPFGSDLLHSEFVDEGIAVLGIDNAVTNEFRWEGRRFITPEKYETLQRYTVYPGDVLITIMGTCGRCAIVPDDIPTAINTKHLCCITTDKEKCLPSYLHAFFLYHGMARQYLRRVTKGAIMDGLNMGLIKDMPIPLAPIELQERFDEVCKGLSEMRCRLRDAEDGSHDLFNSLVQQVFRGEL